jgi:hypothetical protein
MVFANFVMTTHVNKIVGQPPVNSMVVGGYKSADAVYPRRGYKNRACLVTAQISNHKNGHYVRPNRVAIKYLDFFLNVDFNVHVIMFNCNKG